MAIWRDAAPRPGVQSLAGAVDIQTDPETAFSLLCEVRKWPVWLSLTRSADLVDPAAPLSTGSEIVMRPAAPGGNDELFEVEHFIRNYHLALVGAYSVRRRIDFRIERKNTRSKLHARIDFPAYGGKIGALYGAVKTARRLSTLFDGSLVRFKHLVEYDRAKDALLADF